MVKVTIEGNVFEGTPEEIRETVAMLSELAKAQEGAEKKEPVKQTRTIEGKEYENLGRVQPQEGDYVVYYTSQGHRSKTQANKPYLVLPGGKHYRDDAHVLMAVDGWNGGSSIRDVYRLVEEERPRALEVGDYVRFKKSTDDITAGKEYEVVSHDGTLAIIDDINDPRTILLQQRSRFEIRGVDYNVNAREEDVFKEGDIVEHGRAWFGREGIGEVDRAFEDGSYLVKGVNDKGIEVKFYLRPHNMKLIATVENREDIEGTE